MNLQTRLSFISAKRDMLSRSTAPRKLILSNPADRHRAACNIVKAREVGMYLGIKGYDRFLVVAAVMAYDAGDDYVADELARQAQD